MIGVEQEAASRGHVLVDRCPHSSHLSVDFAGCSAFQPTTVVVADSLNRPLGTVVTCRHLAAGNGIGARGGFYPSCSLGAPEARLRWAAASGMARLAALRALQEEFAEATRLRRQRLFELKARLVEPMVGPGDAPGVQALRDALDAELCAFLATTDGFLSERAGRFEEAGLPVEPLAWLVRDWARRWARSRDLDDAAADPLGVGFSSVRSDSRAEGAARGGAVEGGLLRITDTDDPAGVVIAGEIDVSTAAQLEAALADAVARTSGDLHVDLSGVLFCDVGGLSSLVEAARRLQPPRRLVLRGMPAPVARIVAAVGWCELANLVIGAVAEGTAAA